MYEFLWFLFGALSYRLLSKLFGISQVTIVFQTLQYDVLRLLATAAEDISFIKSLKYKTMLESNIDPEQIKKSKLDDVQFFENFKGSCIRNIHSTVPNYIKLSFDSWKEGMDILSEYYRRRLNENNKDKE